MWESGGRTGGRSAIAEFGRRSYNTTWLMARARKTHHPFTLTACESYLVKLEFARAKRSGGFRRGAPLVSCVPAMFSTRTPRRAVAI